MDEIVLEVPSDVGGLRGGVAPLFRASLNAPFTLWPSYLEEEVDAATRVMRTNRVNYWTGEEGQEFGREFAAWCVAKHAVALANDTVASNLALEVLGIGPGDEVIVTLRTFIVSASCIVNAGATVDHDCLIGNGVHVCPGANLSGDVHLGEASWIGSAVRHGINFSAGVTVGAGAAVVDDVSDGLTRLGRQEGQWQ